MEAKDLMIGDWVRITRSQWHEGSTQKVLDVYENGSIRTKHISPVLKDSYEPIPITTEILEANGFFGNNQNRSIALFDEDNEPLFTLSQCKGNYWIPVSWYGKGTTLKYVHELQHALRLYGLDDMADNFKI